MIRNDYYVYAHRKADTNEVFYVGKGRSRRAYKTDSRNAYWKNTVAKHGLTVEIIEDYLSEAEAFLAECELIDILKKDGLTLCNMTDGGEGGSGYKHTDESLEAMRIASSKPKSEAMKNNLSQWHANNPELNSMKKPEVVAKISGENSHFYGKPSWNTGMQMWTEEDRLKISERSKNQVRHPLTDEQKDNIRQATIGRKVSDTSKFHWERETIACPHCDKNGSVANMKRWHFDNCKLKQEEVA